MYTLLTTNYLTEKLLGEYLRVMFPHEEIIHDKIIAESNIKNRPDFRIESLKLIIEFDGYGHFTNPKVILNDWKKDGVYSDMGYTVIRIPYFIQLDRPILRKFFGDYTDVNLSSIASRYPHGFIDKKAPLPASFCTLGIESFENTMRNLNNIGKVQLNIIESLQNRPENKSNYLLVYPSLHHKSEWTSILKSPTQN